jgi:hypothetical protein
VTDEEAALVVDEQFVEFGRDRLIDAEPLGGQRDGPVERCLPVLAIEAHAIRPDLPCAPHARIDDRCRAASIGGALCQRNQLFGLDRKERQRDLTDAVDRQARGQKLQAAGGEEVARPLDRAQQLRQFSADTRHRYSLRARRHRKDHGMLGLLAQSAAAKSCGWQLDRSLARRRTHPI